MRRCISQFFVDDVGDLSCMRLMCFMVDFTVLGIWVWGCLKAGQYVPLGYDAAGLIGMAHGTKAAQSRFEYGGAASAIGAVPARDMISVATPERDLIPEPSGTAPSFHNLGEGDA